MSSTSERHDTSKGLFDLRPSLTFEEAFAVAPDNFPQLVGQASPTEVLSW